MVVDAIVLSFFLPACLSAAIIAGYGLIARRHPPPALAAVALALSYVTADVAARGFAGWWPADPTRRLPWLLALAGVVALWEAGQERRLLVYAVRLAASAAAAYLLIRRARVGDDQALVWRAALAILPIYFWTQWRLLDHVTQGNNVGSLVAMPACAFAAAGVLALTGWLGLSQAFAALGACLAVVVVFQRRQPAARILAGATGGFALGYSALVCCAYWYGDLPASAAALLILTPALVCTASLHPVAWPRRLGWLIPATCLLAPAAMAAALVLREAPARPQHTAGAYRDYCYVSVYGANRIATFALDPNSGRLRPGGAITTAGKPVALAVDADRRLLFASFYLPNQLASFRIDPRTGGLTVISTIPIDAMTSYLATDKACRFLLSATWGGGRVSVHTISPDGTLGQQQHQALATAEEAHAVVFDPENRYVLVPHTTGSIHVLSYEGASGTLARGPAPLLVPSDTGPRHVIFHPARDVAYVVNEGRHSVSVLAFDRATGALNHVQTVSTVPDGYSGFNAGAEIRVHPSGRFLYASNRGHDSIAYFRIDTASGHLSPLGHVATEQMPWSFDLDASGRFLYVAGRDWGRLSAYRVDEANGGLKRVGIYEVGQEPRWVRTVRLHN